MDVNEEALNTVSVETPHLGGWNWGAAFLSIPWGIGNKCYLTLLNFVPVLNLFWWIVCGVKGNKWAWESGLFKDDETFRTVQSTWNRAGLTMFIIMIAVIVLYLIFGAAILAFVLNSSNPYSGYSY